jgi:hypothetical protein
MPQPLMLILRGEQGVVMGVNRACVYWYTATFSSDLGGRVFLCPLEDVKGETLTVKREARDMKHWI